MSAAALTPRVRILVVCDEAVRSEIEEDVFTLEGVRHRISAPSFPFLCTLSVYLLLSNPREGTFQGRVVVFDDEADKNLRLVKFIADFDEDTRLLPLGIDLGECAFPAQRSYTIKVEFTSPTGVEVQKAETSFQVLDLQE